MLRVVCDTNVIVSGLTNGSGNPHAILQAWRRGEIVLLVSEEIVEEVVEVLGRPFFREKHGMGHRDVAEAKVLLETDALMLSPELELSMLEDDPDDNQILACALEGKAEFLVTGDHHLLKLRRVQETRIVTPREFLAILDARPRQE